MLDMAKRVAKEAMVKATGTELEKKIAEACSNKPWGASSTMLAELAQHTYD
ncbi:EpsinR [Emiliania huxleyi CCMP1516]|uniref:ENTH domain-containing protein n=2 Tax=Emiliania huxleyi TaxID=2903 RepID=A0A0D3KNX9_EMIH1|nr:EpsinR [Emiliania huxleyi CCMP1516]EOD37464.1 EpsinR [Emiliania huxleyi CCMP1516]|eukprot:XP_005789893.1 EpsinR [Emiliania huxleyi CCMP1516]